MDSLQNKFEELKKISDESAKYSDILFMEEMYYKLKNDYDMKTQHLITAIDAREKAELKTFELTRALEIVKSNKNDLLHTLNTLKHERKTEEMNSNDLCRLYRDDQNISRIASENSLLQRRMHRNQLKNIELKRIIDSYESEIRNIGMLIQDILKRDDSRRKTLENLRIQLDVILKERERINKINNKLEKMEETAMLNENFQVKLKEIKNEYNEKLEELTSLMSECEILRYMIETYSSVIKKTDVFCIVADKWEQNVNKSFNEISETNEKLKENIKALKEHRSRNNELIVMLGKYRELCSKMTL